MANDGAYFPTVLTTPPKVPPIKPPLIPVDGFAFDVDAGTRDGIMLANASPFVMLFAIKESVLVKTTRPLAPS